MIRIALFADIHGKILLPFLLADAYQKTTGKSIDWILQCGDIGAYPYLERLDKATLRHAMRDRDELGFHDDFTIKNPRIHTFLKTLDIDMICVRGNHEDHDFLNEIEVQYPDRAIFPIDAYQKVFVCKTGVPIALEAKEENISVLGIGRIGDRKNRPHQRFIQDYERRILKKTLKQKAIFDLLITHDKDGDSKRGYGMPEIRTTLDNMPFQYHFFGHTGEEYYQQEDSNGCTISIKIKELEFTPSGILPKACMLILEKEADVFKLEIVPTSLTNTFTKYNWHSML